MNILTTPFPHGWLHYLVGGMFIGLGAALLYVLTGRFGGLSPVYTTTWSFFLKHPFFRQARFIASRNWRLVYALGVILGALAWWLLLGSGERVTTSIPGWQLLLGGLFVGYGARLGGGCASGHGICGIGSFHLPSVVAVLTFMATGLLTANLITRWF